jgi:hypothetical protein
MAVIRFDANVPVEVALKFDGGKQVQSRIPDAPDQMMYTVCGDDTIYLPLSVAAQITQLGIRKMDLISICKRQQSGVTRWEVKRMGDTATAPIAPNSFDALPTAIDATPLERAITDSINQVRQQRASKPSSMAPAAAVATVPLPIVKEPATPNSTHIHHTAYSRTMAAALIAAIDAAREAERYSLAVGFDVRFETEDIRALAATLFIAASKDPGFLSQPTQKVNGGTTWQQQ